MFSVPVYKLPIRMIYTLYIWIDYASERHMAYLDMFPDLRHDLEPDEPPKIYNPFDPIRPPKYNPLNPKTPRGQWWPTQAQEMKEKYKYKRVDFKKINIFTGEEAKPIF